MKIKIERSGGVAGLSITREMDTKELPTSLAIKVKKIIEDTKSSSLPLKVTPKGAADHYNYKISIQEGENEMVMECNQFNLQNDLKSLIKYVEAHSKEKPQNN